MPKKRILVIDDSESIHKDFQRILCPAPSECWDELAQMEATLFGPPSDSPEEEDQFEVDSAFQGKEGVAKVKEALASGNPYVLAFLDYRMPPGWNGFETLRHLREVAPSLPVVLCSAYSDYSWEELVRNFAEETPPLMELKKPFKSHELHQLARALTSMAKQLSVA
ncbi:response regulator [Stigmatella aurantiaca]|uniref:Response regulator n=1 Tax=Stigmatella aurantiaca (strain DW4/3-1) TaxID=378806 RepID=Q08W41_STIAD|nr:response regulator [Stigmatella aurantiaca]ADO73568.1 Response regulator [Stigmatella aurantiaca DW4/3-1]EAU64726.1 response Regulator Receiver Signal Transduction Histidine Kinase [Stigmatella aurantiaca DW4/3-1]